MKNIYEFIVIFKNLDFSYIRKKIFILKNILFSNNSNLLKFENLNKINFSYKLKNHYKGFFVLILVKLNFICLKSLILYLKSSKDVLRFLYFKNFNLNVNLFILNNIKCKIKDYEKIENKKKCIKFSNFKKKKYNFKKKF